MSDQKEKSLYFDIILVNRFFLLGSIYENRKLWYEWEVINLELYNIYIKQFMFFR